MFLTEAAMRPMKTFGLKLRAAWRGLAAQLRVARPPRGQHGTLEHNLGHSADRFELERRERAWGRRHYSEGSLLGD